MQKVPRTFRWVYRKYLFNIAFAEVIYMPPKSSYSFMFVFIHVL